MVHRVKSGTNFRAIAGSGTSSEKEFFENYQVQVLDKFFSL